MKCQYYLILFCLTLVFSCTENPVNNTTTVDENFDNQIGWIHKNCLAIKQSALSIGTQLTVVGLDQQQKILHAKIIDQVNDSKNCLPLREGRAKINVASGYTFYFIRVEKNINHGIAMVGQVENIDHYQFDSCFTTEGILYSVSQDKGSHVKKVWNGYYYLGYESKVTCALESEY